MCRHRGNRVVRCDDGNAKRFMCAYHGWTYRNDGTLEHVPGKSEAYYDALDFASMGLIAARVETYAGLIFATWAKDAPSLEAVNQAIPFFGILMGFATIGHAVWIFDPDTPVALNPGARQADVLIVDSDRLSALPAGWQETVALVMRKPQILVHDRATHQLRKA